MNENSVLTRIPEDANFDLVTSLGADFVIDYRQNDFTENGSTCDIIFDTVGKLSFSKCKNSLASTGIYLDERYPLDELTSAYRYVDTGHKKGNLVINISHDI